MNGYHSDVCTAKCLVMKQNSVRRNQAPNAYGDQYKKTLNPQEKEHNSQQKEMEQVQNAQENVPQGKPEEQNIELIFTPVPKRAAAHKTQGTGASQPAQNNFFQSQQELNETEQEKTNSGTGSGENITWLISPVGM